MSMDVQVVTLAIIVAAVWVGFGWDVWKNGDKQMDKLRTETENLAIYRKAIEKFGDDSQINMAMEEMSELTKELCKWKRGNQNFEEILEEIADVYIMMHQLTLIFDDATEMNVIKNIDYKTKRLEKIING